MARKHENDLIGRKPAFKAVEMAVDTPDGQPLVSTLYVRGNPGSGKSLFLKYATKSITDIRPEPFLIFQASNRLNQINRSQITEALCNSVTSDSPWLSDFLQIFNSSDIDARSVGHEPLLRQYFRAAGDEAMNLGKSLPGILIIADDIEHLSPEVKSTIVFELLEPLAELEGCPARITFLSGKQSTDMLLMDFPRLTSAWSSIQTIEMTPFSQGDLETYLSTLQIADPNPETLWRKSLGNWRRLQEEIRLKHDPQSPNYWNYIAREIIASHAHNEQRWFYWASILQDVNQTTFGIFCPSREVSSALEMLNSNPGLIWIEKDGSRFLRPELALALRRLFAQESPGRYHRDIARAEIVNDFVSVVPNQEHRDILSQLKVFSFFNEELLRAIFPKEVNTLKRFASDHRNYFQTNRSNYFLRADIAKRISAYRELTGECYPPEQIQKINQLWDEQQRNLERQLAELKNAINSERDYHKDVLAELEKVSRELEARKPKPEEKKPLIPIKKVIQRPPRPKYYVDVILQLLGISIFYTSIIFYNEFSMGYFTLGVTLILIGFFYSWVSHKEAPPKNQPKVVSETPARKPKDNTDIDTSLRLAYMRKNNLERKKQFYERRINAKRKQFVDVKHLLEQSFCCEH